VPSTTGVEVPSTSTPTITMPSITPRIAGSPALHLAVPRMGMEMKVSNTKRLLPSSEHPVPHIDVESQHPFQSTVHSTNLMVWQTRW